jgi:uncharacterized protein (DUF2132 family)
MQPNNPLHGKTLEAIMVYLVSYYGWEDLGNRDKNCFRKDPSIKSSLKFLRRTPWAREKVEEFVFGNHQKININLLFVEENGLFIDFSKKRQ